jgi:predicted Zn-dependent peptidase
MNTTPWTRQELSGGLLLSSHDHRSPGLLAARLWIAGGSSADPGDQRGLHQLLAGLLTRGCGDLDADALADLVEGRGAALRAEAGEDSLVISLKCASEDATVLLPLLVQMASRPTLEPAQIAIERQLNLQALQRQREDPFQLCHEALRHQLYGQGPYGHDPLGIAAELEALQRQDLARQLVQLGQRGAALVIAGRLSAAARDALETSISRNPWRVEHPGQPLDQQTAVSGSPLSLIEEDTEQVVLMLGCTTVPLADADNLPLRLLQAHLGLGMSSRLFITLREERGLAYDVGVHMPARRGATPFIWHLSTNAERAGEACTALLDEWQRMLEQPLSSDELTLAKAKYLGQEAMGRQTCGQVADREALLLGFGLGSTFIADCLTRAATLTSDTLQKAAQRSLAAPQLSLCGPSDGLQAAAQAWRRHPLNRDRSV